MDEKEEAGSFPAAIEELRSQGSSWPTGPDLRLMLPFFLSSVLRTGVDTTRGSEGPALAQLTNPRRKGPIALMAGMALCLKLNQPP